MRAHAFTHAHTGDMFEDVEHGENVFSGDGKMHHAHTWKHPCMRVFMYVDMHVYIHVCKHVFVYACMHMGMCVCIHTCMYTHMYVCVHA